MATAKRHKRPFKRTNSAPVIINPLLPSPSAQNPIPKTSSKPKGILRKQRSVENDEDDSSSITPTTPHNIPRLRIFAPGAKFGDLITCPEDDDPATQTVRWCGDRRNVNTNTENSNLLQLPTGYGRHFPQDKETLAKPSNYLTVKEAWMTKPPASKSKTIIENDYPKPRSSIRECEQGAENDDVQLIAHKATNRLTVPQLHEYDDLVKEEAPQRVNLDIFITDTLDPLSEDDRSSFSGNSPLHRPMIKIDTVPDEVQQSEVKQKRERNIKSAPVRRKSERRKVKKDYLQYGGGESSSDEEEVMKQKINPKLLHVGRPDNLVTMVSLVSPTPSDNEWETVAKMDQVVQNNGIETKKLLGTSDRIFMGLEKKKEKSVTFVDDKKTKEERNDRKDFQIRIPSSVDKKESTTESKISDKTVQLNNTPNPVKNTPLLTRKKNQAKRVQSAPAHGNNASKENERVNPPVTIRINVTDENEETTEISLEENILKIRPDFKFDIFPRENNDGQLHFKNSKEKELWYSYQKLIQNGVGVSYETFLRGMLTPTEFRKLDRNPLIFQTANLNGCLA